MKEKTEHQKGVSALILLALVFASMGLFARYLSTGFLLFQQVYLRMLAALVVGYLVFRRKVDLSKFTKLSVRDWMIIIFRAVSYSLFGIILFTQAIILTKYSNVSFIGSLPMTAVLGFILLHEKFSLQKLVLVLLAFAGVLLISIQDYSNLLNWGRGEVLTLISTVFFSLSYIARKWQTDVLNNQELTAINFLVAFLAVFLVSLAKGDGLCLCSNSGFSVLQGSPHSKRTFRRSNNYIKCHWYESPGGKRIIFPWNISGILINKQPIV